MLLATSATKAGIIKLISEYYCSPNIRLDDNNDIYNSKGKITSTRVILKNKRYRFETSENS